MNAINNETVNDIRNGDAVLGIELGSTRIKAVLIGHDNTVMASGEHSWENRLENGIWTYSLDDAWSGLQGAYAKLVSNVFAQYHLKLTQVSAIGISGMMHGYLPFDKEGNQLAPFRTWRNTITEEAAAILTSELNFNIPQRWSIAHLYQSILNGENHVKEIDYLTTLAGYLHWRLTGEKVIGIGEASGMFPIDSVSKTFDLTMTEKFNKLIDKHNYTWRIEEILPSVLTAGENAGLLTKAGALLIDPTGMLNANIPLCPPEGDAGTGMVATNSIFPRSGNVSAGTSIFAMIVLEKRLTALYPEIDIVTTPAGMPVAMVHGNNCTSDLDAWVKLFGQVAAASGAQIKTSELYDMLYEKALAGSDDAGGLLSYNYVSGEHVTNFDEGRPLFVRKPDSTLGLENFMRALIYATFATLKLGLEILTEKENVHVDMLTGHGGLFKTPIVGQKLMAGALSIPISVMDSAGEGGAWGIALLAKYLISKSEGEKLESFLSESVFKKLSGTKINPDDNISLGFNNYMTAYKKGLAVERAAVENI